jgi:hypothetical protein
LCQPLFDLSRWRLEMELFRLANPPLLLEFPSIRHGRLTHKADRRRASPERRALRLARGLE